jgi:hypothetical protein
MAPGKGPRKRGLCIVPDFLPHCTARDSSREGNRADLNWSGFRECRLSATELIYAFTGEMNPGLQPHQLHSQLYSIQPLGIARLSLWIATHFERDVPLTSRVLTGPPSEPVGLCFKMPLARLPG